MTSTAATEEAPAQRASAAGLPAQPEEHAAGAHHRRQPVPGSVVLSIMPSQPEPRAAWAWRLPVSGTSPGRARSGAGLFLSKCRNLPGDLSDVAVLLVSELVTNAYSAMAADPLGPASRIELSLRLFGDRLLIEVIDSSPNAPVPNLEDDAEAEGWRGLAVVHRLSQEWGYFWRAGRKVVYCILPYEPEMKTEE